MTDDGTPVELSWSWSPGKKLPVVRYSIETIGHQRGLGSKMMQGREAAREFVKQIDHAGLGADWTWYRKLTESLISDDNTTAAGKNGACGDSKQFFAFDLSHSVMTLKAYYVLDSIAQLQQRSKLDVALRSLEQLELGLATSSAVTMFEAYMRGEAARKIQVEAEMLAIDCLSPVKSRAKVYVRSRGTSLSNVLNVITLGGTNPLPSGDATFKDLKELWCALLALNENLPLDSQLPETRHRTAGILYYLEFRPGSHEIKSKVYIPVRHYARDDLQVAIGLQNFLKGQNMGLGGDESYIDAMQEIW